MAWLSDWAKRIKITIDHNDVDAGLSHFPVLVYLSLSSGITGVDVTCIFDEVGANSKKIAVTKSDGTTELYVEIEKWDSVGEKAWLWVSRDGWAISNTADTDIYIYYDNTKADNTTYVGDPNSTPAENVWDSNFKFVSHMRDDPDTSHVRDSTSNNNDGTKQGTGEPAVTTSGKVDDAQDFDGVNDNISIAHSAELASMTNITLEAWINADATQPDTQATIIRRDPSSGTPRTFYLVDIQANVIRIYFMGSASADMSTGSGTTDLTGTGWHYVTAVRDDAGNKAYAYINGVAEVDVADIADGDFISSPTAPVQIGCWRLSSERRFNGIIDEVRISSVARSAAWIKASYESGRDHFVTYGTEEGIITIELFQEEGDDFMESKFGATF